MSPRPGVEADTISGVVVVGNVSGDVIQGQLPLQPYLPQRAFNPHGDEFGWLEWSSRLSPEMLGRDDTRQQLLDWARRPGNVSAQLITGAGGVGKSRLAAELAEALQAEGWSAGFLPSWKKGYFRPAGAGLLLILDYPEEARDDTLAILRQIQQLEPTAPVRILLLSRREFDFWQPDIDQSGASSRFDRDPITLEALDRETCFELFESTVRELSRELKVAVPPGRPSRDAFYAWLTGAPTNKIPLFVCAAAIQVVVEPDQALNVVPALVRRELRRLRREGRDHGLEREALPRLLAIAAISDGLDLDSIRRLADPSLEVGLPARDRVADVLRSTSLLKQGVIPAPKPDIVAAALVSEVFKAHDRAPSWVWDWIVEVDRPTTEGALSRIARLAFDAETTLQLRDWKLSECAAAGLRGRVSVCREARAVFGTDHLDLSLLDAAVSCWTTLIEDASGPEEKAELLNNLSVHLSALGRREEGLTAIEEAVGLYRELAEERPDAFRPDLVRSLNNLSNLLSELGRREEALAAVEESLAFRRELAEERPDAFRLDLAGSLNNLSNRLSERGRREEALAAIKEAVGLYRELAEERPDAFRPDLAMSLNNLSGELSALGRREEGLTAIEEAVALRRELAEERPDAFRPDLAGSLNNLSNRLSELGRREEALAAIKEAIDLIRPFPRATSGPRLATMSRTLERLTSDT